ncbi:MAG: helix-turn-helix transcriptional regulator [Bdellovibrionales bacterium]|nr:helix-turn-helix transcriptional regulator [Bdellovibrionales bacterium]
MNNRERLVLFVILMLISVSVLVDLITDSRDGVLRWHLIVESAIGCLALYGAFYLVRERYSDKRELNRERERSDALRNEAAEWRLRSRKYVLGLSNAIDEQLSEWRLTPAEKEVAFLLLKGLSLKEIAHIRDTSERTARVQSLAIYSKAGLSGRSELAAFFLEDLLLPATEVAQESSEAAV